MEPKVLHILSEAPNEYKSPLSPETTKRLIEAGFDVLIERSASRIYHDDEFEAVGAQVVAQGSWLEAPQEHHLFNLERLPPSAWGVLRMLKRDFSLDPVTELNPFREDGTLAIPVGGDHVGEMSEETQAYTKARELNDAWAEMMLPGFCSLPDQATALPLPEDRASEQGGVLNPDGAADQIYVVIADDLVRQRLDVLEGFPWEGIALTCGVFLGFVLLIAHGLDYDVEVVFNWHHTRIFIARCATMVLVLAMVGGPAWLTQFVLLALVAEYLRIGAD